MCWPEGFHIPSIIFYFLLFLVVTQVLIAVVWGRNQSFSQNSDCHGSRELSNAAAADAVPYLQTRGVSQRNERSYPSLELSAFQVAFTPHGFLPAIWTWTTKPESQRPDGREGIISTLDTVIVAVNLAERNSNIPPAKAGFCESVSALLATNRVCLLLSCNDRSQVHTCLGLDGRRTRLRRARVALRCYLPDV